LLTGIILAAMVAHALDRRFKEAAVWSFLAAVLSAVGFIHAYELSPLGLRAVFGWMVVPAFPLAYAVMGGTLILFHLAKVDVDDDNN
jgi:AGZA family xanthine/uracil permease-like MFS transporter